MSQAALRGFSSVAMPDFDYTPPKYTGPSIDEMKEMRAKYLSPAAKVMYKNGLMLVDGKM